jgi:hypothetical protein
VALFTTIIAVWTEIVQTLVSAVVGGFRPVLKTVGEVDGELAFWYCPNFSVKLVPSDSTKTKRNTVI